MEAAIQKKTSWADEPTRMTLMSADVTGLTVNPHLPNPVQMPETGLA